MIAEPGVDKLFLFRPHSKWFVFCRPHTPLLHTPFWVCLFSLLLLLWFHNPLNMENKLFSLRTMQREAVAPVCPVSKAVWFEVEPQH